MDFSKLDMITSAGIRILMMAVKRLGGTDRVALWGINQQIKVVFQIAGLAGVFQVFENQQAAIDHLKKPSAAAVSRRCRRAGVEDDAADHTAAG